MILDKGRANYDRSSHRKLFFRWASGWPWTREQVCGLLCNGVSSHLPLDRGSDMEEIRMLHKWLATRTLPYNQRPNQAETTLPLPFSPPPCTGEIVRKVTMTCCKGRQHNRFYCLSGKPHLVQLSYIKWD